MCAVLTESNIYTIGVFLFISPSFEHKVTNQQAGQPVRKLAYRELGRCCTSSGLDAAAGTQTNVRTYSSPLQYHIVCPVLHHKIYIFFLCTSRKTASTLHGVVRRSAASSLPNKPAGTAGIYMEHLNVAIFSLSITFVPSFFVVVSLSR